ncbi:MAG: hypothetical protein ACTSPQ_19110 [Candidatus Helarchaeota archaeon]
MTEIGSSGYYYYLFNLTDYYKLYSIPHQFQIKINATKAGYDYSEIYVFINLIPKPTNTTIYVNGTEIYNYTLYYMQTIVITAFYYDYINNTGIESASVYFNETKMTETADRGNYTIKYNATIVGSFIYVINGSKHGYAMNETTIIINVLERPTTLTVALNATVYITPLDIYFDQMVNITAVYNDTLSNTGINNATLNISVHDNYYQMSKTSVSGNYTWLFNGTYWSTRYSLPHQFNMTINASLYGYENRIKDFKINIIIKSANLSIFLNGTKRLQWTVLYGETVLISAYYEDIIDIKGIEGASVNISGTPMTPDAIAGNYTYLFRANQLGIHQFIINATKLGYNYNETSIQIEVIERDTNITLYLNGTITQSITMYYNETLNITIYYEDLNYSLGIENAVVNITESSTYDLNDVGNGYYTLIFNATLLHNYTFIVNADKYGYQNQSMKFNITILKRPTELIIYVNSSIPTGQPIYYNQTIIITAYYNDTIRKTGIENASVNITLTIMEIMTEIGNGNYSYSYKGSTIGTFLFTFNATKYGYKLAENSLTIQVIEYSTEVKLYMNSTEMTEITIHYNESVIIELLYNNTIINDGIAGADVKINESIIMQGNNSGYYYYIFNGTTLGDFYYYINASKYGYINQSISFTVHVVERPTNITIYINKTIRYHYTIYYNESLVINAYYNDTLRDIGITQASINITLNPTWTMKELENGNYTWIFNATEVGTFNYIINGSKYGYEYNMTTITIIVLEIPTELITNLNVSQSIYFDEYLNISAFYNDTYHNMGLIDGSVNLTIFWNNTIYQMKHIGNGNFSYLFNGSVWGRDVQLPYNFTIKINASLYGYQTIEQIYYIIVNPLPTNTTIYLNNTRTNYYIIDKNDTINITVYFENTLRGIPIIDGFVNVTCISNPSIADNLPMTPIGDGNYSWKFDPTSSGIFNFVINGTKIGHSMSSKQFTIVVGFTDIVTYLNGQKSSNINIYYDEVVNITVFYNDTSIGSGITGASVNLTILWNNTLYNMKELSGGNYTWLFNASQWYIDVDLPYQFNIFINASESSHQYAEKSISIRINNKPTNLTIYLNQTEQKEITCYYDESVNITVFYEDLIDIKGITGASVNVSNNPALELGNGYYSWIYYANQLGDFILSINATKHGFEYNETNIIIHVIERITNITVYINSRITYNYTIYYNDSCLITGFFNDTIRSIGIDSAFMKISNITYSWTMKEIGGGNYTWMFNATKLGNFIFIINSTKYGYKFNQTTINIHVIERPSTTISFIGGLKADSHNLYYNQTCSVILHYNDTIRNAGINGANTFINNTFRTWQLKEIGNGNYTWTFNATNVGVYQFSLNASRYGYQYSVINITIVVMPRPTNLGILINNSQVIEYTLYYNQTYVITVNYTDILTSNGIENATVKLNSTLFVELGNGIYELQFKADVIKNITYIINATLNGNYTSVIRIIRINIIGRHCI